MSSTRITTPFGAESTAGEVIAGITLSGKRAVVTAHALASAGAQVTLAVRDVEAGHRTARDIIGSTGNRDVLVSWLDLADQPSVAAFVAHWSGPLHILVDNAGIMATPELRTPQGWEMQFATNHLGHFALTTGLHDALAAASGARVVVVSSIGHVNGEVLFDDLNFERHPYDPWAAYAQSKTANILFTVEAATRWAGDGITVNALNPGRIASTDLGRHMPPAPASFDPSASTGVSVKTIEQGTATSVLLAASRSTASPASTSRTARKQYATRRECAAVSRTTRSTPRKPPACGRCRLTYSPRLPPREGGPMPLEFTNKTAPITGGGSGIGRSSALALAVVTALPSR
jgi:NAD(P)-dependent dehydrogenase (short-subunit alcohol dehydrogenase family)